MVYYSIIAVMSHVCKAGKTKCPKISEGTNGILIFAASVIFYRTKCNVVKVTAGTANMWLMKRFLYPYNICLMSCE
jgi:hypothetical protein